MKQALIINGSPRKNGATAQLIAAFQSGLPAAEVHRFDCFETPPLPCDDCRFCRTAEGCRHRDLDAFYAALEAADVLVFAAPVYNRSFPAPMKAVLDRLQRYWSARFYLGKKPPIATPKQAVLLTVGGANRGDGAHLAEQLAPILTILNCAPAEALHADGTDTASLSQEVLQKVQTLAKQVMTTP